MKNPVLLASLSLVGTIVGAGIFGIPYVFSRTGLWISLAYCVILGAAALMIHWFYACVAAATPGKHRLVGYVQKHLGRRYAEVASVTNPMNLLGSLLAYLILGGGFLSALFGGSEFVWSLAFFAAMSFAIILPFKRMKYIEAALTWILIAVALVIIIAVAPHIELKNLFIFGPDKWFLPFGIVFFSFGGASVVPDIVESLGKNLKKVGLSVAIGTIIAILLTAGFGLAVAGVTGLATTENAIPGLIPFVGRYIIVAGAVFGLFAVATSFLTIGENIKDQFHLDFKMSLPASWIAATGIPLVAYLFGARNFIGVLGFVGAVFGVIDGILIALMARHVIKGRLRVFIIPLIVVFAIGLVSEIVYLIK